LAPLNLERLSFRPIPAARRLRRTQ